MYVTVAEPQELTGRSGAREFVERTAFQVAQQGQGDQGREQQCDQD